MDDGPGPLGKHQARNGGAQGGACVGASVPTSPKRSAREARPGFRVEAHRIVRAWLLLAQARLRKSRYARFERRILDRQVRPECTQGRARRRRSAKGRLAMCPHLGVRGERSPKARWNYPPQSHRPVAKHAVTAVKTSAFSSRQSVVLWTDSGEPQGVQRPPLQIERVDEAELIAVRGDAEFPHRGGI